MLFKQLDNFRLHLGTEFFNREQVNAFAIRSHENVISQSRNIYFLVAQHRAGAIEPFGIGKLEQFFTGREFFQQRQRRDIVDTGGNADVDRQGGTLGFIFFTGFSLSAGTRSDKFKPGVFNGRDKLFIFSHETVAGENRIITVIFGNGNNLVHPLDALFLAGTAVVGHPVNAG